MASAETSTVSLYIREKNKAGKWAFAYVDDKSKKLKPMLTEGQARYYISSRNLEDFVCVLPKARDPFCCSTKAGNFIQ